MTEQLSADELNAKCIDLAYRVGRLQGRVDVWNSDVERTLEEMEKNYDERKRPNQSSN